MNNYQAGNIKSLDYFEHIRKYPGMYIGSKDSKGLLHCVKEIISNSIDEYLNGAGNQIIITLMPNNGIRIEDNGRGIPHGTHSSGCSVLQACFGIANTGGKFDNATGESGYNTSGGEHGTGGKAVNALSTKMIVKTRREGVEEIVEFSKGQFISHKENKIDTTITGTSVEFYPDDEVLETVEFDIKAIKDMVREFSFLCKGLTFIVNHNDASEAFVSEKGLSDYLDYLNPKHDFLIEPLHFEGEEGKFQLEVAIGYNTSYSSIYKLYTNNIPQEKGTHLTGFKAAWTTNLNQFAREQKFLKEKDENLAGSDFEEGLIVILNFKMIDPVFKGQNKEELSSSEGRTYVQRLTSQALKDLLISRKSDIKVIIDKAINARKAREAAKKAKDAARNNSAKGKSKLLNLPTKLVDSWSKKRSECELLIAEGDSAAGGLVGARDGEFQAVFPVRGKTLNLLKATHEKIFANQEVVNIIKAIGLELDPKTKKLQYDASKLRYGRIILCADADPDGQAIKNLLLTCFWTLCPELVINGHIHAAIPPLFRITTKKNDYIYVRDAAALEEYKRTHVGEKYAVNRNKGLGEQDPEELAECLLNHETRNVAQITVDDVAEANRLFEIFMGPSATPRKDWILEHSEEANIE
jgi:DNA gyrase subunit B